MPYAGVLPYGVARRRRDNNGTIAAADRIAMPQRDHTTLWMTPRGIRCVVLRYDDTRYQLRLVRELGTSGTIKAGLFVGYSAAITASQRWREEYEACDVAGRDNPG